jgi:hypothetical protein
VRRRFRDAGDPDLLPAIEDGGVLGDRDLVAASFVEVDVRPPAVVVAELGELDREVCP